LSNEKNKNKKWMKNKFISAISKINFRLNYKKEGLSQFIPVLYVRNGREKALLFGFGKHNVAVAYGRSVSMLRDKIKIKEEARIEEKSKELEKLTLEELLSGVDMNEGGTIKPENPIVSPTGVAIPPLVKSKKPKAKSKKPLSLSKKQQLAIGISLGFVGIVAMAYFINKRRNK